MVMKIAARVEIDAKPAQQGAAEATKAVTSIGSAAEQTAAAMARFQQIASQGLRPEGISTTAAELDRLRAKFNPLYAEISKYKQTQAEIRAANAAGALSTDEMTAALDRNRRAAMANIDAIKGRNTAIAATPPMAKTGVRGFETANLAAQFQDIGVTAAMGMSPLQIALQQGTQLSSIIGGMQSPIRGLVAAFRQVLSPVSLLTIGVVAAGAATIQYFMSTGDKAKTADAILKAHADTVGSLKERYGEAASGLREFVNEGMLGSAADIRDRLQSARDLVIDAATAKSTYSPMITPFVREADTDVVRQWREAFIQLRASIREGQPDILRFRDAMARIGSNSQVPEGLRKLAGEMRNFKDEGVVKTARAIPGMVQQLELIGGKAQAQIDGVAGLSKELRELAGIAMPAMTDAENAHRLYVTALSNARGRAARDDIESAYQDALRRIDNNNPFVINSDGNQTNVPIPGNKPVTLGDRDRAAERSATSTANAYRDLIKTADDRVAQMKLEAQLAGQTGVASDALRFKLDLLQQSEDKGRSLTSAQVEAINKRVEAFKKYAEEAAKASLKANLLFEREQMGRSAMDQQIASGLRGAGLEIDFDSYEAGLIRTNLQLQYARELAGDFANTFFSSFEQGKSVLESLGDAGVSALKRIANTMMNDVLNSIFSVNNAASGSGGGFFSSLLGGLGSLFGGGFKETTTLGNFLVTGHAEGGYTGAGGKYEPAGIVHRGEVVWSQRDVARAGGPAVVDAMRLGRRGYDDGGVVGVTPLMRGNQTTASSSSEQRIKLFLQLGIDADDNGNIIPVIKRVVAEDAPGIAVQVVEDFSTNGLPDRIAAYNQDPRAR